MFNANFQASVNDFYLDLKTAYKNVSSEIMEKGQSAFKPGTMSGP